MKEKEITLVPKSPLKLTVLLILFVGLFLSPSADANFALIRSSFLPTIHLSATTTGTLKVLRLVVNHVSLSLAVTTGNIALVNTGGVAGVATVLGLDNPPLAFPNPFSMTRSINPGYGQAGTQVGYRLTKNASAGIEIQLYDMFGNRIMKKYISPGQPGTQRLTADGTNYNKVPITMSDIGYQLSNGVYFYFIFSEGKLLGKGKFLVVP